MVRHLIGTKTSPRKTFLIKDQDNLVKIKQLNVMEVVVLYAILLEKIKRVSLKKLIILFQ
jgi:hypothetical protein